MKFYPYQQRFFNNRKTKRFRIVNKSRQIGFSETIAREAVDIAFFDKVNVLIASSSQRQSDELGRKCSRLVDAFTSVGWMTRPEFMSKEEIRWNDRAGISILPSNPYTVRGFSGNVYLDEYSSHKDQKEVFRALLPSITRGYNLTIVSTPQGQSDHFYELFSNKERYPDFDRTQIDIYQAISDGCPVDIELIRRNIDDETFRQEYCCEFIDEASSFFPYELIRSCVSDYSSGLYDYYALGVDVGRKHDKTVIYVLRVVGNKAYTEHIERLKNASYELQESVIVSLWEKYKAQKMKIDSTGIGNQLSESLKNKLYGVEAVPFTNQIKEKMVTQLRKAFELRDIQIPDDRELINNIHSIKKTVTSSNNIRFEADRNEHGHADDFWALALAYDCLKSNFMPNFGTGSD